MVKHSENFWTKLQPYFTKHERCGISNHQQHNYWLNSCYKEGITVQHCTPFVREFNSLAPGRFQRNFRKVIFQLIFVIGGWSISCKIVLKWMPMELSDGKSTLVEVMAWCRQATSHYLSQSWPRSLSPYGVIRPRWVNGFPSQRAGTKIPLDKGQ